MGSRNDSANLERRIVIGMIVSTDYLSQVRQMWDSRYLQSSVARMLAGWVMEYYDKYQRAPFTDIQGIYYGRLQEGRIAPDVAEEIEEDILPGLSEEYERGEEGRFNHQYLLDQTRDYFRRRHLLLYSERIQELAEEGELDEAEEMAGSFRGGPAPIQVGLDLSSDLALDRVDAAFTQTLQRVVGYPGALGRMWNDQLVRGGFVALMGPEKRGKTYMLLDIALRAITKRSHVAFFEAGDMTEAQLIRRICIYLCKKSDRARYCGNLLLPVKDCLLHQLDECDDDQREDSESIARALGMVDNPREARERLTRQLLARLYHEVGKDYVPCTNCRRHAEGYGSVWLREYNTGPPLTAQEAKDALRRFFRKYKRRFRLSTHPAKTLSVKDLRTVLDAWERQDGFVPDVIVIDYADLLAPDPAAGRDNFRHQQNDIWARLRGLSEERHCLVVTATQADAASYEQDTLRLKNFSEDKRKYAHVTAMYGLNQDRGGREKALGLMRVNELVVREGEFSQDNQVYVLQCLPIGRPFLGSFRR